LAYPSVLDSLLPRSAVLANTDDDVDSVVAGVESLSVTLGTVTDDSEGVVLEVVLQLGQRPVGALRGGNEAGKSAEMTERAHITTSAEAMARAEVVGKVE
jgi:hypothetical protein